MPLTLLAKIRSGYLIAFLLLTGSYIFIFYIVQKLVRETREITHSYTILNRIEALKSAVLDAETGVRGYLLTKEITFLMPYYASAKKIPNLYNELHGLVGTSGRQAEILDSLKKPLHEKLGFLSEGIQKFQGSGLNITEEMLEDREESKLAMQKIRNLVEEIKSSEEKLMMERSSNLSGSFSSTETIALISLLIGVLTIIFSLVTFNRENKAKEEADQKALLYQEELENKVEELRKANAELKELRQMEKFAVTGRIARTIAHEVRNPLTNISLASEQLEAGNLEPLDTAELLNMINRNAGRINQLVADLLNSTRFSQLSFEEIEINQVLDDSLELARDRIGLNNIEVRKQYFADGCRVNVDIEKMKLAFLNIIVNAIEAMEKDKGVLTLKTLVKEETCLVQVGDNGSGMDEDALQKIFEPYFTAKPKGTGLGLTNTQTIIYNHGGKIKVKSVVGEGTDFIIILNQA